MTIADKRRYAQLLSEKHPHIIRTEAENERALREVEALMARGKNLSPPEAELLALLALLIEKFEEEHYRLELASAQDVLRELMAARKMSQADVSTLFPSKGIASEVLAGKRSISKAQARKLGAHFHVPPSIFLDV